MTQILPVQSGDMDEAASPSICGGVSSDKSFNELQ